MKTTLVRMPKTGSTRVMSWFDHDPHWFATYRPAALRHLPARRHDPNRQDASVGTLRDPWSWFGSLFFAATADGRSAIAHLEADYLPNLPVREHFGLFIERACDPAWLAKARHPFLLCAGTIPHLEGNLWTAAVEHWYCNEQGRLIPAALIDAGRMAEGFEYLFGRAPMPEEIQPLNTHAADFRPHGPQNHRDLWTTDLIQKVASTSGWPQETWQFMFYGPAQANHPGGVLRLPRTPTLSAGVPEEEP